MIGDTVEFTSKAPYKIRLTGRTQQFINAFGEEIMVSNTDHALAVTCQAMQATIADYTRRQAERNAFEQSLLRDRDLPATTEDGTIFAPRVSGG